MGFLKAYKRYVFFLMLGMFLAASVPVAQAGWLDFLDPRAKSRREANDPSRTLIAPFADQDAVIDVLDPTGNNELAVPLEQRHRPNTEIARWVQQIVPTVLTYSADGYQKEYTEKIKSFSKVGASEYVSFMRKRNIIKTLQTGRYNVSGFVDVGQGYPIVINEGAVDGRYRWLFQMNVALTFVNKNLKKYSHDEDKKVDSITQNVVLTTQLGRVRGVDNEHGLLIETWSVKDAE